MIHIIILGAGGRMGQLLVAAAQDKNIVGDAATLTAAVVRRGSDLAGKAIAQKNANKIIFTDDAADAITNAAANNNKKLLVIDFSTPSAVVQHAQLAAQHGAGYLCGVTGLGEAAVAAIKTLSAKTPTMLSANTSLGVAGLARIAGLAAGFFTNYRLTISETHHVHKKDKPSGTALMLGRVMEQHNPTIKINYESKREGEVIGDHSIVFDGEDDVITLSHHAKDRKMFAVGAVRAGLWLCQQAPGFYTIDDFLKK
ncbi:MAG: dihydrodipicolinate reductase C-terminal domain-containing protein [Hydrotalea sp.]|nr:dihydrodipicolinate reductase C-terminal domain-containing protein [Hydrotalea sp.]